MCLKKSDFPSLPLKTTAFCNRINLKSDLIRNKFHTLFNTSNKIHFSKQLKPNDLADSSGDVVLCKSSNPRSTKILLQKLS